MKGQFKIILFSTILIFINPIFAQEKIEYYKNGQNGIELIYKSNNGTTIVSTFNAKLSIKEEVAKKIYEIYLKKPDKYPENTIIDLKVKVKKAKVLGQLKIIKKNKLTSINFYYQRIEWKDGLIEEHKQ